MGRRAQWVQTCVVWPMMMVSPLAAAQQTPPRADPAPEEIVVTGSHIARPNETSQSPVAVLTNAEAKFQGTTHVEDLLNSLPQANAGLNGAALGPTGTATVDLRGFGAFRTLVLMNGRRLNPGDPINPSADLNSVPASLIKRVEVLTGGASSIYGSDAVAGVVNFIMDDKLTGLKFDAQYGINQDDDGNRTLQSLARTYGIRPGTGSVADGGTLDLSLTYGGNFAGGAGHVTAYAGYRHTDSIASASRDYAACPLIETGSSYNCIRDRNTALGTFQAGGPDTLTLDPAAPGALRVYDATRDGYNVAERQNLQRPDTRYDVGVFANYEFSEKAKVYLEAQYSDDQTTQQYEPASTALNSFNVNCDNPLLSADQVAAFCTANGLSGTALAPVTIGRRNVEGSPRLDSFGHRSTRIVLGLKGDLDKVWSYDLYGNYGIARSSERIQNDLSLVRLGNALDVIGVGGVPTCRSVANGSDPQCVPYNIFAPGGVTPAALAYVSAGGAQHGYAEHEIVSGVFSGKLGEYGIRSPFAKEGVAVALGGEYRVETIKNTPGQVFVTGDLASSSPQNPVQGTYNVYEFFGELHAPLIEGKPFFEKLSLELSDRYAKYSLQGVANSYNIGLEWEPIELVRFRSSYSQAIRAPNGHELFIANTLSKFQQSDPCSGPNPTASQAGCAFTGVTPAQYGNIVDTGNFNFLTGGNTKLRPETAKTVTVGAVFTPSFVRHLSFSVDYWRIKVGGFSGSFAPNATLANCINTGLPLFCNLVQRDPGGSLSQGNGLTSGRVIATNINTGSFEQSGIDLAGNYTLDLSDVGMSHLGRLSFYFTGSVQLDQQIQTNPAQPAFDCTGLYGPTCTGEGPTSPIPRWRNQLRVTWSLPKAVEISLNWRHIDPLLTELGSRYPHLQNTVYPVDARIPAYDYFDLAANADLNKHFNIRLGVNNVFNRKSPIVGANNNPQILPGNQVASFYDIFGRYIFAGLTALY